MAAMTLSGHPGIKYAADPRLVKRYVPGRPVWLRTRRAYAPLFLRLAVLLDQIEPLKPSDTWSWAYRPARLSKGLSDHSAGCAIDCWSSRIGAVGRRPTPELRAKVNAVLDKFKTADGRRVFAWGGDYKNTPDPMHFNIARGITPADAAEVIKRLGIASDGTVR